MPTLLQSRAYSLWLQFYIRTPPSAWRILAPAHTLIARLKVATGGRQNAPFPHGLISHVIINVFQSILKMQSCIVLYWKGFWCQPTDLRSAQVQGTTPTPFLSEPSNGPIWHTLRSKCCDLRRKPGEASETIPPNLPNWVDQCLGWL